MTTKQVMPTAKQFYILLAELVDEYFFDGHNYRDIALLGSDMTFSEEHNSTLDPACWYEWLEAIDGKKTPCKAVEYKDGCICYEAINGQREFELPSVKLSLEEGYDAAIRFLTKYATRLESKDIKEFIEQLSFEKWSEMAHKMFPNE